MSKWKCFISAKYGVELDVLQRVLESHEVDWQWAESTSPAKSIIESISDAIKRADFVIGIFSEVDINANVMLQLGMAIGREIPLLILSTGKNVLPFDLTAFRQFDTDLGDEKLLAFQIDLFLRSLNGTKQQKRRTSSSTSAHSTFVQGSPGLAFMASALERNVASAIQEAGGRVTVPSRTAKTQSSDLLTPDLLMWLPQQDKELFNPAAVEVKRTIGVNELPALQARLAEFVRTSSMGCGLIIVDSVNLARNMARLLPYPYIFVLGFGDFTSRLKRGELASWLKQERNRLAHGVR